MVKQQDRTALNFQRSLDKLERLSPEKLDDTSRRIRSELGSAEWKMALCLLALKRNGAFRKLGYGTLTDYSERVLNLSGRKTGLLIGAAEALEHLPLMSQAFRLGKICWGKVRAIHGLATPETEHQWIEYAAQHGTREVERKVMLSPREWKRHKALGASIEGKPIARVEQVEKLLVEESVLSEERPEVDSPLSQLPSPPKTVRLVFEMTPDQYALYEQAESRVRAQQGRRVPRAEVLGLMADTVLSTGTARARSRHQVLVHTSEDGEQAWYETERGVLPVGPDVLKEALDKGEVLRTDSLKAKPTWVSSEPAGQKTSAKPTGVSSSTDARETTRVTTPQPTKRTAIPNAIIRQVFARAGHCCERCGSKGGRLDVHHRTPVSEGGGNSLHELELLCRACHTLGHETDLATKPHWRAAKRMALSRLA